MREFLLNEFTEENIEYLKNSKGLISDMRIFSKLAEFDIEANGFSNKKLKFNSNDKQSDLIGINETFQDMNLTDELLLSSEKHLEVGKTSLLSAEICNLEENKRNNSSKIKDRNKLKSNQADSTLNIEMKNFEFNTENSFDKDNFDGKISNDRIENVDNLAEEIVIKETKGPILFKIDNYELEYIRVWRKIKLIILSICVLVGFLFYISLPIIIGLNKIS